MATYRAVCSCGYRGRTFTDPNRADEHAEIHAMKNDPCQGGRSDGRNHRTSVEETQHGKEGA